jgi:hypothetical protein
MTTSLKPLKTPMSLKINTALRDEVKRRLPEILGPGEKKNMTQAIESGLRLLLSMSGGRHAKNVIAENERLAAEVNRLTVMLEAANRRQIEAENALAAALAGPQGK